MFAVSTGYTVGQFVRRITPTLKAQWVMRCTVAGTSAATEPTWPTTNNGTVVSGGATFANITGQSAYGWSAAAGDIPTLIGAVGTSRFAAGDRMFVSSDHSETQTATSVYGTGTASPSFGVGQVLSVNRAGSVPPVAADLTAGATVNLTTGAITLEGQFPLYHYGMTYASGGSSGILFNSSGFKTHYFDTCQLSLTGANAAARIQSNASCSVVLNNSTLKFSHTSQFFQAGTGVMEVIWLNTAGALASGSSVPASYFFTSINNAAYMSVVARGVDFSAVTTTLVGNAGAGNKLLFDSCRIAPGVARLSLTAPSAVANTRDLVELINCYDGTNILNESYQPAGAVTTERTITLSGGAADDVGTFSHKLVSNTNIDKFVNTLNGFWMDVEYQTTGASKTATVEIISSASLNNDEISLLLEYQGTSGSSVATLATTMPATVLTTVAAVTASTATWNSSPPTPVKQKLEVVFTPQTAGRVRGQVRLGKPSATVYVNPVITIT